MNEKKQVIVWDPFVRVFHWSLVLFIFLAYVTGDSKGPLHKYIGFVVLGLVVTRIFWGFWGSQYALFSNFMCSPAKALNYLKKLATGGKTHYTGHNPAAAWMVILFLVSSIIICMTGYAAHTIKGKNHSADLGNAISLLGSAYADQEKDDRHEGKRKGHDRHKYGEDEESDNDSVWSDIHEISSQFMLLLICLHIVGVAVSSRAHNENLVKSMITGKKDTHDE